MDRNVARIRAVHPYVGLCGAAALFIALQVLVPLTPFCKRLLIFAGSALLVYFGLALILRPCKKPLARLPETAAWGMVDRVRLYASRNHVVLMACALVPSVFLLYGSSLSFGFFTDDFFYLWLFHVQKLKVFSPFVHQGTYRYSPLAIVLTGLPSLFVEFRPFLFHAQCLVFHLLNCLLVYWLCYRLTRNKLVSLAACALFCAHFSHYEVVFWVTGICYSGMTIFFLCAFLCFIRYLEEPKALPYAGFLLSFALALLTFEIASLLLVLCPIYEFLHHPPVGGRTTTALAKAKESIPRLRKYILPALLLTLSIGIKPLFGISLTNKYLMSAKLSMLRKLFSSTLYLMMPNDIMGFVELTPIDAFVATALFGALILYVFRKGTPLLRFFFLWGLLIMYLTVVASARMGPRYLYLPAAGFSPFLAIVLYDVCRWAGQLVGTYAFGNDVPSSDLERRSIVRLAGNVVFVLLVGAIVLKGATYIKTKGVEWQRTSTIVTNTLGDISRLFPEPPVDKELYFVNMPEYLAWWLRVPATFYQETLITALHMRHDERWKATNDWMKSWLYLRLHMAHSEQFAKGIHFRRTKDNFYVLLGTDIPVISPTELQELSRSRDVMVLLFDTETDSLVRFQAGDPMTPLEPQGHRDL